MAQNFDNPQVKIFKASAGSGKTHTIATQFLRLTLPDQAPGSFKKILAVTFTNKASDEMKQRIIDALNDVIANGNKSKFLDNSLKNNDDQWLRNRAKQVRSEILHGYTFFSISTIDSFVQRVVRTFAYDLRLPASFKIQLDTARVIAVLYEMLMEKIEVSDNSEYADLRNWLIEFTIHNINEKGRWSIERDIQNMAALIFREEFLDIWESVGGENVFKREKLRQLKPVLDKIIADYEQQAERFASRLEPLLQEVSFEISRSALNGIVNFLKDGIFKNEIQSTALKFLNNQTLLFPKTKLSDAVYAEYADKNSEQIRQIGVEAYEFAQKNFEKYYTAKTIRDNFYLLGIFGDLLQLLSEYRSRFNEFLISDLTVFLRKIISRSDAPFVYERIGQYYRNILIDEFQDTSRFQWDNFRPLIKESLARGNSSMIVGDVKQSIYRWRNGDWRILLYGVEQEFGKAVTYLNKGQSTNWRSHRNIVEFNNEVFSRMPELVQELYNADLPPDYGEKSVIIDAYADARQKVSDRYKETYGKVEVVFVKDKHANTDFLIDTIRGLVEEGYKYSDIAILVRKNREATQVAQALIQFRSQNPEYDFTILSNEALFLEFSPAVNVIVSTLYYLAKGEDYYLYSLVYHLSKVSGEKTDYLQVFLSDMQQLKQKFLPAGFEEFLSGLEKKTLYDIIQQIIKYFRLYEAKDQYPYLRSFEDAVIDFMYDQGSDLELFLLYWEENAAGLSVDVSESENAIRILTIHKAKGLDFPVVIMPYVNWSLDESLSSGFNRKIIWAKPASEDLKLIDIYPVVYSKNLMKTEFAPYFYQEHLFALMDSLNVLYVGFTRPVHRLVVLSNTKLTKKSKNNKPTTVGDVLYLTLQKIVPGQEDDEAVYFVFDKNFEPVTDFKKEKRKTISIENYAISSWYEKTDIKLNSLSLLLPGYLTEAAERGTLMHEIMSNIRTMQDIEKAVKNATENGLIPASQQREFVLLIENMIRKAGVEDWFSENWQILTETGLILSSDEHELRPDRVIYNDEQVIVIDFKFARPSPEHKKQVAGYMQILRQVFPGKQVKGYLLYETGRLEEVKMAGERDERFER